MFAQKLRVEVEVNGEKKPCPLEWLDSFAMRNFTRSAEFDDTLPIAEGRMEAGLNVSQQRLAQALEEWFNGRGMGQGKTVKVQVSAA
jgi:hypothetical protein